MVFVHPWERSFDPQRDQDPQVESHGSSNHSVVDFLSLFLPSSVFLLWKEGLWRRIISVVDVRCLPQPLTTLFGGGRVLSELEAH